MTRILIAVMVLLMGFGSEAMAAKQKMIPVIVGYVSTDPQGKINLYAVHARKDPKKLDLADAIRFATIAVHLSEMGEKRDLKEEEMSKVTRICLVTVDERISINCKLKPAENKKIVYEFPFPDLKEAETAEYGKRIRALIEQLFKILEQ